MAKERLTNKQWLFVTNYLVGMTGTDAAMTAYSAKNSRTAAAMASELLKKPNIARLVNAFFIKE